MKYIPNNKEILTIDKCECCGKKFPLGDNFNITFCAFNAVEEYTKIVLCTNCLIKYQNSQEKALLNAQIAFYKKCKLTDKDLLK